MVVRGEITEKKLEIIYDTIRATINKDSCYYTKEEVEKLKEDSKNIFFKGGERNAR